LQGNSLVVALLEEARIGGVWDVERHGGKTVRGEAGRMLTLRLAICGCAVGVGEIWRASSAFHLKLSPPVPGPRQKICGGRPISTSTISSVVPALCVRIGAAPANHGYPGGTLLIRSTWQHSGATRHVQLLAAITTGVWQAAQRSLRRWPWYGVILMPS
jgi:hypothetical protein